MADFPDSVATYSIPQCSIPAQVHAHASMISELPQELLEYIFLEFVRDGRHSPIVLAHVCRLWRELTDELGGLWRHIDLQNPEQAKHHLMHSHWHTLDVVWLNRSYGPGARQDDYRQWLWSYSYRFATLNLAHMSKTLRAIFQDMSFNLPELAELIVIGQDISLHLRVTVRIHSQMPKLRRLSLSHIRVTADDLLQVLTQCPAVENLDLVDITLAFTAANIRQITGRPSISLPQLDEMRLVSINSPAQCFILSRIIFPPRSSLLVCEATNQFLSHTALYHGVLVRLEPCFTVMRVGSYSILLSAARHGRGCALTLEIMVNTEQDWLEIFSFSMQGQALSAVHILELPRPIEHARFHVGTLLDRLHALQVVRIRADTGDLTEMSVEDFRTKYVPCQTSTSVGTQH